MKVQIQHNDIVVLTYRSKSGTVRRIGRIREVSAAHGACFTEAYGIKHLNPDNLGSTGQGCFDPSDFGNKTHGLIAVEVVGNKPQ